MTITFDKMIPVKSYQHVVEQVENAIVDGTLRQGDKLPSEMKLKDMFGTSRGTIREALRVLEQKGLVSIRTGVKGGARIKAANTEAMRDSVGLLIRQQKVSVGQLAEFREYLEGCAAEKAAASSDMSGKRELKEIISEIAAHIENDPQDLDEFHRLDARFHRKLAEMAANPLIEANLATVHENIHVYFQKYLSFSKELLREDFDDLRRIAEAVEEGAAEAAGKAARAHIARFTALMENAVLRKRMN